MEKNMTEYAQLTPELEALLEGGTNGTTSWFLQQLHAMASRPVPITVPGSDGGPGVRKDVPQIHLLEELWKQSLIQGKVSDLQMKLIQQSHEETQSCVIVHHDLLTQQISKAKEDASQERKGLANELAGRMDAHANNLNFWHKATVSLLAVFGLVAIGSKILSASRQENVPAAGWGVASSTPYSYSFPQPTTQPSLQQESELSKQLAEMNQTNRAMATVLADIHSKISHPVIPAAAPSVPSPPSPPSTSTLSVF